MASSSSLHEYLKRYSSTSDEPSTKKKKKKKKKAKASKPPAYGGAVTIVDDDPLWQAEIKEESPDDDDQDDAPLVYKDVEVIRMQKMEALKLHRPYISTADDGSGWVEINDVVGQERRRHDSPDLSPIRKGSQVSADLSPPRVPPGKNGHDIKDLSPPRKGRQEVLGWSPKKKDRQETFDSSPSRLLSKMSRHDSPDFLSSSMDKRGGDSSPRIKSKQESLDSSPPRLPAGRSRHDSPDSFPLRKGRHEGVESSARRNFRQGSPDLSPQRQKKRHAASECPPSQNGSKKREKMTDGSAAGLQFRGQLVEEIKQRKEEEIKRFSEMDALASGRAADTVYRDRHGRRLDSLDEMLKLEQVEKPKVKPLEWGKGLAQKKEAEDRQAQLEAEKLKPFARSRDDPDLDKELKERVRWGDPMAYLVKKKTSDLVLEDLGDSKEMKDSGFMVPQDIPKHSWLKRGITAPPNRYNIKPGRHWDGVDRSNGFEKDMYKRQNEKKANELEAYLWSVSDM